MKTVLFIDDDEIYNYIHKKQAQNAALADNVLVCISAISALVLLKELFRMKQPPLPEIIFLDLMMPLMDGFQFLDELEKLPHEITDGIKVIVITSSLNEADFQRAFNYKSVIDIIKKPMTNSKMLEIKDAMHAV
jgi:CheY-like chemotaxis protein